MHVRSIALSPLKSILPAPAYHNKLSISKGDVRGRRELRLIATQVVTGQRYGDEINFHPVVCREHRRTELVPSQNFFSDLQIWYHLGLHPRFSISGALLETSSQYWEVVTLKRDLQQDQTPTAQQRGLQHALTESRTATQFLKKIDPWLLTTLYHQRRRYRVEKAFKQKFLTQSFTTAEFFAERNQERRRLMLRRGVDLPTVLKRLRLVGEDVEGRLYREGDENGSHYLYVVCPSTKQEYLLSVPRGEWREEPLPKEKWIEQNYYDKSDERRWRKTERVFHEFTPSEARRWTFNLPADAQFAKEA